MVNSHMKVQTKQKQLWNGPWTGKDFVEIHFAIHPGTWRLLAIVRGRYTSRDHIYYMKGWNVVIRWRLHGPNSLRDLSGHSRGGVGRVTDDLAPMAHLLSKNAWN